MKNKKIFCSSPNKVIHGGLTNWLCFDKTGTLTEDFMDFNCLVMFDGSKFVEPITNHQIAKASAEGGESTEGAKNDKLIKII